VPVVDDYQDFIQKSAGHRWSSWQSTWVLIWIDWNRNNFIELITSFR